MNQMELKHFAHHHTLTLFSEEDEDNDREECWGCEKPILGPSFRCKVCDCFFLHKSCAELPREINHFGHPDHPLTLLYIDSLSDAFLTCEVCEEWEIGGLVYYCRPCEFYLDIGCAQLAQTIENTLLHKHPLALQLKVAVFRCNACGIGRPSSSLSYKCASCHFWVHPECISLPSSIEHTSHHHHPLTLVNSSDKLELSTFQIYCEICAKAVKRKDCIYYCEGCRFFAHVCCVTTKASKAEEPVNETGKGDPEAGDHAPSNHIEFPMPDESSARDLISHLLEQVSLLGLNHSGVGLKNSSDDHQFTLCDAQMYETCDACVRPISAPYYSCPECPLILHKSCAELPSKIQHPSHARHPLSLMMPDRFLCNACGYYCNGFSFKCDVCSFYLDIKCASLPTAIKHQAHRHLLNLGKEIGHCRCSACHYECRDFRFKCNNCEFSLHIQCALLPQTLRHRYCKHVLTLMYSSVGIESGEYYCPICEEGVNTHSWFYFCADCDIAFHSVCLCKAADKYANVKLGSIIRLENHPHSLTLARKAKYKPPSCDQCGDPCEKIGFECKECKFNLDVNCGWNKQFCSMGGSMLCDVTHIGVKNPTL